MEVLEHVRNILERRLDQEECLVVYDPAGRYRPAAEALDADHRTVIYGDEGTIEGRENAMEAWLEIGKSSPGEKQLLIYLPTEKPSLGDDADLDDPYIPFIAGGGLFPSSDAENYMALCIAAKENHEEQIRSLFEEKDEPSLDAIEAIDQGASYPQLQTVLSVESNREILRSLLSPTENQKQNLEENDVWKTDCQTFAKQVLGYGLNKPDTWEEVQSELARYTLFSEFVFDLPQDEALPASLEDVPRADASCRRLVRNVCDDLRESRRHEEVYRRLAREVADDLSLGHQTREIDDFGELDTFAFEERAFLQRFVEAMQEGDREEARSIIEGRHRSIWADSEGSDWILAERLLDLSEAIDEAAEALEDTGSKTSDLVDFYTDVSRHVDTLHRSMEQTIQEAHWETGILDPLVQEARKKYRAFADDLQTAFTQSVESEGWPPTGMLRQTQVFDATAGEDFAERGLRVAYVMVDSFRYELAAQFAQRFSDDQETSIQPAAGHMPSTTRVGMAALLPEADGKLRLETKRQKIVPTLGQGDVVRPEDRIDYLQQKHGDRCAMVGLNDLMTQGSDCLDDTVQLLVVKTREIDTAGEAMGDGVQRVIGEAQETYFRAVNVLSTLDFDRIHFVTDHGFLLLSEQEPGDSVSKPVGDWTVQKERCLMGAGGSNEDTLTFPTGELGTQASFDQIAVPKTLGAFRMGSTYMHSGLSLQESIVPVLTINLKDEGEQSEAEITVQLSYRGGRSGYVTTRRPMIEVEAQKENMFGPDGIEFRLEARSENEMVGGAASSSHVDPSTRLVSIDFNDSLSAVAKVPLDMTEDFRGEFEVVAIDPITQVRHDAIPLQTDYLE